MKLVNITRYIQYTSKLGDIMPGKTTGDHLHDFEKVLEDIVKKCGNNFGVILNDKEAKLLERLIALDEAGSKFNPNSIPVEVRKDPTGIKRLDMDIVKAQHERMDCNTQKNVEAAKREAMINGEVSNFGPIGLKISNKEVSDADAPKSGFQAILEANARIASGEKVVPEKDDLQERQETPAPQSERIEESEGKTTSPAEPLQPAAEDAKPHKRARGSRKSAK